MFDRFQLKVLQNQELLSTFRPSGPLQVAVSPPEVEIIPEVKAEQYPVVQVLIPEEQKQVEGNKPKVFTVKEEIQGPKVSHDDDSSFFCGKCSTWFASREDLSVHALFHSKPRKPPAQDVRVACEVCGKLMRKSALKEHILVLHEIGDGVTCPKCQKVFPTEKRLIGHITKTHSKMVQCSVCDRVLKNKVGLKTHMRTHSETRERVRCGTCQKEMYCSQLLLHMRRVHSTKPKPYACQYCSATFSVKNTLLDHETMHTNTIKYTCHVCGKGIRNKTNWYTHLKRQHPEEHAEWKRKNEEEHLEKLRKDSAPGPPVVISPEEIY